MLTCLQHKINQDWPIIRKACRSLNIALAVHDHDRSTIHYKKWVDLTAEQKAEQPERWLYLWVATQLYLYRLSSEAIPYEKRPRALDKFYGIIFHCFITWCELIIEKKLQDELVIQIANEVMGYHLTLTPEGIDETIFLGSPPYELGNFYASESKRLDVSVDGFLPCFLDKPLQQKANLIHWLKRVSPGRDRLFTNACVETIDRPQSIEQTGVPNAGHHAQPVSTFHNVTIDTLLTYLKQLELNLEINSNSGFPGREEGFKAILQMQLLPSRLAPECFLVLYKRIFSASLCKKMLYKYLVVDVWNDEAYREAHAAYQTVMTSLLTNIEPFSLVNQFLRFADCCTIAMRTRKLRMLQLLHLNPRQQQLGISIAHHPTHPIESLLALETEDINPAYFSFVSQLSKPPTSAQLMQLQELVSCYVALVSGHYGGFMDSDPLMFNRLSSMPYCCRTLYNALQCRFPELDKQPCSSIVRADVLALRYQHARTKRLTGLEQCCGGKIQDFAEIGSLAPGIGTCVRRMILCFRHLERNNFFETVQDKIPGCNKDHGVSARSMFQRAFSVAIKIPCSETATLAEIAQVDLRRGQKFIEYLRFWWSDIPEIEDKIVYFIEYGCFREETQAEG